MINVKTLLTVADRERMKAMIEAGQNIAFLLNQKIIKGETIQGKSAERKAIIDGLLVSGEDLRGTKFIYCDINWTANKTDLRGCIIRNCILRGEANYADFSGGIMRNSDFTLLQTKHADFRRIDPCGMKISLFTPNVFGWKCSKSLVDLLLKIMWKVEDDGFVLPEDMLRG